MTTLLFVEHGNGQIKDGTLKALTAAKDIGAPVHALVLGAGSKAVAEAAAKLRRAHAIGPLAQLDLERADNQQLIEAVMPNERFASLGLKEGETLVVRPRRIEVFVDEGNAI